MIIERDDLETLSSINNALRNKISSLNIDNNNEIVTGLLKLEFSHSDKIPSGNQYAYIPNEEEQTNRLILLDKVNNLNYPVILKPGDGVLYYEHKFENQAKVYKLNTIEEAIADFREGKFLIVVDDEDLLVKGIRFLSILLSAILRKEYKYKSSGSKD